MSDSTDSPARAQLHRCFRVILALLTLAALEGVALLWLWRAPAPSATPAAVAQAEGNMIREAYPDVDFSRIYPGMSDDDVDRLQRETFGLRYGYQPFVQFAPLAASELYVEVTKGGYRRGAAPQPWPPVPDDTVVFVFGGSTTFGYGVADEQTVVASLQKELVAAKPDARVQCYNFGSGYYFSTQERVRFESLLLQGVVPDIAIFVDGLNDFYFRDGRPELTNTLHRSVTPDLPPPRQSPIKTKLEQDAAVQGVLRRYERNLRLVEAAANQFDVEVLFVGQPVPFFQFDRDRAHYPFQSVYAGHRLCALGYPEFERWASTAGAGPRFLWAGDAFSGATTPMYVDGVHYSREGAAVLANTIARRLLERGGI